MWVVGYNSFAAEYSWARARFAYTPKQIRLVREDSSPGYRQASQILGYRTVVPGHMRLVETEAACINHVHAELGKRLAKAVMHKMRCQQSLDLFKEKHGLEDMKHGDG